MTGAAAGIGAAIAELAAASGWTVGILDADEAGAESAADRLGAIPLSASVTDPAAIERAFDAFGPVDAVIHNAGIVRFGPLADLDLDDWRAVVDVNLTGTFVVGRAAAARLTDGGSIVNIGSMNGVAPGPNAGAYGATKAGVHLLTQQMALEFAPRIRVNAVAPGLIDAGMSAPIYSDPATRAAREAKVPLGRLGRGVDVARAALWLASGDAGYITGHVLVVDGGVTMAMIANLPRPAGVDGVGA